MSNGFYTQKTVLGTENVDIASSWEEVVQVLEVPACRPDKEEIQRQVSAKLTTDGSEAKQVLYEQLVAYLKQRETELEKMAEQTAQTTSAKPPLSKLSLLQTS